MVDEGPEPTRPDGLELGVGVEDVFAAAGQMAYGQFLTE